MTVLATFFGTSEAALDSKGRTVMPVDYRENFLLCERADMQSRLYMARNDPGDVVDGNPIYLTCFGHSLLYRMSETLTHCDDGQAREIEDILESVSAVRFDNAGRFSIGAQLMAALEMKERVLFKGYGSVFEIWPTKKTDRLSADFLSSKRKVFRRLSAEPKNRGET